MEKDAEMHGVDGHSYDFGARMYDARVGRFLSTDPLSNQYPEYAPYLFATNSPITSIDIQGKEVWVVIWGSQSTDVDGDGQAQIGHAGIIVTNYKEVQSQRVVLVPNESGDYEEKVITITDHIPDGTYTYYDLWPGGDGADMSNPNANVVAAYVQSDFNFSSQEEVETFLKSNDPSEEEGYAPDGVLRLNMDYSGTTNIENRLINTATANSDYNARDNNCSTYICGVLNGVGYNITPEENTVFIAGASQGVSPWQSFHTPNNTYNQLASNSSVTVVKDAGTTVSQDYEDAVIDPAIKAKK